MGKRGVCTSMIYRMGELLALNLMQHTSKPGKERYAAFSFTGEQEDDLHNNSRMGGRALGRAIHSSLLVAYML